jgi:DNA mismatch repair ATPase MutS
MRTLAGTTRVRTFVQAACDTAWLEFQGSLNEHYVPLRSAVRSLAALDALQSLALVSSNQGYAHVVTQQRHQCWSTGKPWHVKLAR